MRSKEILKKRFQKAKKHYEALKEELKKAKRI
jgi:hypothetical protein